MKPETTLAAAPDCPLWRISDAAALAGIGEKAFLAAAAGGDIPVEVLRVGRMRYVRSSELVQWLRPLTAQAKRSSSDCTDLFA